MNSILLFLLSLCQVLQQICAQIVFNTTTVATTAIVNNRQCLCYPGTTCPTDGTIDIRIVNTGTTCPSGQVYCCMPGDNTSCGIPQIPPSSHPPGEAACGAYPWQVAILTNNGDYLGGGVLVRRNYVLTAAHKVQNYLNGGIIAKLGARVLSGIDSTCNYSPVNIPISTVTVHPNYNSMYLLNDIAVLRLSSNAPIAPNINTACFSCDPVNVGTRCWVTGWGKNAFGSNGMNQNILKEVDVPLINRATCEALLRGTKVGNKISLYLDNSTLCAGGEAGKDACTGDGGSPLVCQMSNGSYQVKGLVIWGIDCAKPSIPGVYADVCEPSTRDWILHQINCV